MEFLNASGSMNLPRTSTKATLPVLISEAAIATRIHHNIIILHAGKIVFSSLSTELYFMI